jgi:hypothetical protein
MRGAEPDDDLLPRVYILSLALMRKYSGSMLIQFDVFRKDRLMENPELVYASELDQETREWPAADLLGLIVVETDGTVVPISYGFSRYYSV